jgi:hypothetical protein
MTRSIRNLAAALLAGVALGAGAQQGVSITHVQGLSYSADGKQLMVPSHHGLAVYSNGKWSKAPGPQHDYMGFSASAKHLYSSGHPAPGSGMVNPFGVIRSRDGGRTWDKLGLEGETDFHLLATSWNAGAIYVWNPAPSSRLRAPGLHSTRNDGFLWNPARAAGLEGAPRALAVHPEDAATVALATEKGVYLSRDSGKRFAAVASGVDGLAVRFDLDGRHLWYGAFDGQPILARVALEGGNAERVPLPALARDAVAYIAQNPARRDELAIATFRRNVFLSPDRGRTWRQIAAEGQAR